MKAPKLQNSNDFFQKYVFVIMKFGFKLTSRDRLQILPSISGSTVIKKEIAIIKPEKLLILPILFLFPFFAFLFLSLCFFLCVCSLLSYCLFKYIHQCIMTIYYLHVWKQNVVLFCSVPIWPSQKSDYCIHKTTFFKYNWSFSLVSFESIKGLDSHSIVPNVNSGFIKVPSLTYFCLHTSKL